MGARATGLVAVLLFAACGGRSGSTRPVAPHPWLPPQIVVHFENRIGSSFRLEQRRIAFDGRVVLTEESPPDQAFEARVDPGRHEVTVELKLRGEGAGVFSYLRAYTFAVRGRRVTECEPGRRVVVHVLAYERGGPTTPLEQRPAVQFEERQSDL